MQILFEPKRMLVTGGAGFIGSNFINYLLAADPNIVIFNLDNLTYAGSKPNANVLAKRHHFLKGDINDFNLVSNLLIKEDINCIVHFAAESHVDRSINLPSVFMRTNVKGTLTLLEAAKKVWLESKAWNEINCRFHHISTDEVYGSLGPDDPEFTEQTAYAPNSPYAASKAASDHWVRAYAKTYNLPTTITHCSNNYGPYQHPEKLIPKVITACLKQKVIPVYGDGSQMRDWLYVTDHCLGIDKVIRYAKHGNVYNMGGGYTCSNLALVQLICTEMDKLKPQAKPHINLIQFVSDRPGHDWRYAISIKKIQKDLDWFPQESFATGLTKTLLWYISQGDFA